MPSKGLTRPTDIATNQELLDLIPRMRLFAGEDETTFEDLRHALLLDLSPTTPYEIALAENLVTLEWEAYRHRTIRDSLIRTKYREFAQGTFTKGEVETLDFRETLSEEAEGFANALMDPPSAKCSEALDWLAERNIDPGEILAAAYQKAGQFLEPHERKLAELEIRRRRLRDDLDRLKASRTRSVADAEVLIGE